MCTHNPFQVACCNIYHFCMYVVCTGSSGGLTINKCKQNYFTNAIFILDGPTLWSGVTTVVVDQLSVKVFTGCWFMAQLYPYQTSQTEKFMFDDLLEQICEILSTVDTVLRVW